jgi:chromosome segregation ATPase
MIPTLIGILISVVIFVITIFTLRPKLLNQDSSRFRELEEVIKKDDLEFEPLLQYNVDDFVSERELAKAERELREVQSEIDRERETLKRIETTLAGAQAEVEQKETEYQNLKVSKKADEERIAAMHVNFEHIELESTELERTLAESLSDLNDIISNLEEHNQLREVLENLSHTASDQSKLARELHLEYRAVSERVAAVAQQQKDLEDEYTRLVEKQLG